MDEMDMLEKAIEALKIISNKSDLPDDYEHVYMLRGEDMRVANYTYNMGLFEQAIIARKVLKEIGYG